MKAPSRTQYPDISDIFKRKAEGRERLAALTFSEKIVRLEALNARLEPLRQAREANRAAREANKR
jgi:hypothetical protein